MHRVRKPMDMPKATTTAQMAAILGISERRVSQRQVNSSCGCNWMASRHPSHPVAAAQLRAESSLFYPFTGLFKSVSFVQEPVQSIFRAVMGLPLRDCPMGRRAPPDFARYAPTIPGSSKQATIRRARSRRWRRQCSHECSICRGHASSELHWLRHRRRDPG